MILKEPHAMLQDLNSLPKRLYGLTGLALGEVQSRDLSELHGASRKGVGTAVTSLFCNRLVKLVQEYGQGQIRVLSGVEPYVFGIGDLEISVYAMRRRRRLTSPEAVGIDPHCFRSNGIKRPMCDWIDEANAAQNRLPGQDWATLFPLQIQSKAVLAVGFHYESLEVAPRLEFQGSWLGYPSNYDRETKHITGWFPGWVSIEPQHDLMAALHDESPIVIEDEKMPPVDNVLPFRPRIFGSTNNSDDTPENE